jgi:16S rRNA (guanine(966)-N(2))-methyltransferase RsmD
MRITGGVIGRRLVQAPKGPIRPTQDRVRAALFSILGPRVPGCRFLDLFAGSGAVGLEAWSRGARRVVWVEQEPRVFAVLRANVARLGAAESGAERNTQTVRADALRYLARPQTGAEFDLIFADPPYAREGASSWLDPLLDRLAASPLLAPEGWFIMEQRQSEPRPPAPGWDLRLERRYGDALLRFFSRPGSAKPQPKSRG